MGKRWMAVLAACSSLLMDEYFYQIPSALSGQLRNATVCNRMESINPATHYDCTHVENPFHIDAVEYNLLFAISAFGTALSTPFHQFFLRRFGSGVMSFVAYLISLSSVFLFAIGASLPVGKAISVMLIARFIQGMTRGLNLTAARRMISKSSVEFQASSFITILVFATHFGGALNFWITGSLGSSLGLEATLWISVAIAALFFMPAILLTSFLRRSEKKEQVAELLQAEIATESFNWYKALDKKVTPAAFWWLCWATVFFLATIHNFIANAPQMLQDMGFTETQSSYGVGIVYVTGLLLPLFAFMVDYGDRKDIWMIATMFLLILGFAFQFTVGSFSLLCFCMGIAFALHAILLPACMARILPPSSFKAGMDVALMLGALGIALSVLTTGGLLKALAVNLRNAWVNFLIFEVLLAALSAFLIIFAAISDAKNGKLMRKSSTIPASTFLATYTKFQVRKDTDLTPTKPITPELVTFAKKHSQKGYSAFS